MKDIIITSKKLKQERNIFLLSFLLAFKIGRAHVTETRKEYLSSKFPACIYHQRNCNHYLFPPMD